MQIQILQTRGGDKTSTNLYPRNLEIDHFNISISIDKNYKFKKLIIFDIRLLFFKVINIINRQQDYTRKYRYYKIESPEMLEDKNFIKNVAKLDNRTYFCGYFQHLNCFAHIEPIIRTEFTLKTPLSNANQQLKEQILQTNDSVFLHIRRGDYMKSPYSLKLATGYYNGALRAIAKRVAKPYIFVFSDDMNFTTKYLLRCLDSTLTNAVQWDFVNGNDDGNAIQEMELMRTCQNAIIANSTFSWWAAYLIDNPHKIVVMPSRFFYDDTIPKVHYIKPKGYVEIDYNWGFEI